MRYPNYPGVGKRIINRLKALGYITPSGGPDISRFIREKHYDPRSFYPWTKDRTPQGENLIRLAQDLGCSPAYLLFGTEMPLPIGGGSAIASTAAPADALPLASPWDLLPLIRQVARALATAWARPLLWHVAHA